MKHRMITMVVVAIFATLAAVSVRAQSPGDITVSIPFAFAVGGKTLPAGDYCVRRSFDQSRAVVRLESKNDAAGIYLATHPVQSADIQTDSKLVFNKYDGQLFLTQVWIAGRNTGEELNKTSRERGLQREIANSARKPETVAIVAKRN